MLHGIPTPSGGVKTSRLRVFWSELRVHGDQADHWPQFQPNVSQSKVAGNRFVETPFGIFNSERSTKTEAKKTVPNQGAEFTIFGRTWLVTTLTCLCQCIVTGLTTQVILQDLKSKKILAQKGGNLKQQTFWMKFLSAFQRALLDFATYNYNCENESLSHWDGKIHDFQKKVLRSNAAHTRLVTCTSGTEMLQVFHRSRKWHVFYHLFRRNFIQAKVATAAGTVSPMMPIPRFFNRAFCD